jgi:hypothetical protein
MAAMKNLNRIRKHIQQSIDKARQRQQPNNHNISSKSSSFIRTNARCMSTASTKSSGEDIKRTIGARPVYFQRSATTTSTDDDGNNNNNINSSILLTPYDLKGTSTLLPSKYRYLSPCLGAALSTSPFIGNLMRLGQRQKSYYTMDLQDGEKDRHLIATEDRLLACELSQCSFLSNNLFFQMIRESPIHLIKNKSMPASYLTPSIIGSYIAVGATTSTTNNDPTSFRTLIRRQHGIRSNRISENQWTGISLARWMDLFKYMQGNKHDTPTNTIIHQTLLPSLWLVALWGTLNSKQDILEYYNSFQNSGLRIDTATFHDDEGISFTEDDFKKSNLDDAMDTLIDYYSQPCTYEEYQQQQDDNDANDSELVVSKALELVCTNIALQTYPLVATTTKNNMLPIFPNGYFAHDDGDIKVPDCVEVTIREIFYLLLWDESLGNLDLSRLPASACPRLKVILISEVQHLQRRHDDDYNDQIIDFGQAWFDLLSDQPRCDYLAVSPSGKRYELAPTTESIVNALWHIMTGKNSEGSQWKSLSDMAEFWSNHNPHHKLFVGEDRLQHLQSTTLKVMEHEYVCLQLENSPRALEIRLRCDWEEACGMAAVTRLTEPRHNQQLDPNRIEKLWQLCCDDQANREVRGRYDPSLHMLCLALPPITEKVPSIDTNLASLTLSWLGTRYGPDRRQLNIREDNEKKQREFETREAIDNRQLLKERILKACQVCRSHPAVGTQLLCWILGELPTVIEKSKNDDMASSTGDYLASEIEQEILLLPNDVLDNDSLIDAIKWNWACRGRILAMFINRRRGKVSMLQMMVTLNLSEWVELATIAQWSRTA